MYHRNGRPMPEKEEGAAFFEPIRAPDEPRVMGLQPSLLTQGFTGFGAEAYPIPSDEEAALNSGTPSIPEVVIEGRPMGDVPFYETSFWRLLSLGGAALGAYHGYKRNNSVGWAIGWGLLGSIFPVIVIPVAFAQGIGKRKGR